MSWKKVKIGDIFNIEKGVLQSLKCTPGDYTFITAAEDWKTNHNYSHDCEALIFAAAASGSLGRTHYITGKFISSDLCFILTEKDKINYPLELKFYHFVFNNLKDTIVKAIKTGTSKEAINYTNFYNYELNYFGIQQQRTWIDKLLHVDLTRDKLLSELDQQQTYLHLIRQTILQEAVQGKLTKQDLTDEPARELLKRIKAEKEKLIKAGKRKKEKELPLITEGEIPFELPKGWICCRLGDISKFSGGGTPPTTNVEYWSGNIPWVTPKDMKSETVRDSIDHISETAVANSSAKLIDSGSVLVVVRGMVLLKLIPIAINEFPVTINQDMKAITLYVEELNKFIQLFLLGHQVELKALVERATHGTGKLDTEILTHLTIPLPPLPELHRIVYKVQQLQQQLNQLEAQVQQSREYAQQLLQTVLKEAFEPKSKLNTIEKEEIGVRTG